MEACVKSVKILLPSLCLQTKPPLYRFRILTSRYLERPLIGNLNVPNIILTWQPLAINEASKINDYCLTDQQCQLADRHSHCKWKIPHVYGLCKCPPNYKHLIVDSEAENKIGSDQTATSNNKTIRCVPSK